MTKDWHVTLQSFKLDYDSIACFYDVDKKNIVKMEYYVSGKIDSNWYVWCITSSEGPV